VGGSRAASGVGFGGFDAGGVRSARLRDFIRVIAAAIPVRQSC